MFFQTKTAELEDRIKDLNRLLEFERREREADQDKLTTKLQFEGQQKRLEHIEGRYKAEAMAKAYDAEKDAAKKYADKTVEMAMKIVSDFGNATGKALEQFTSLLKEFKPVEQKLNVLPVISSTTEKTTEKKS